MPEPGALESTPMARTSFFAASTCASLADACAGAASACSWAPAACSWGVTTCLTAFPSCCSAATAADRSTACEAHGSHEHPGSCLVVGAPCLRGCYHKGCPL